MSLSANGVFLEVERYYWSRWRRTLGLVAAVIILIELACIWANTWPLLALWLFTAAMLLLIVVKVHLIAMRQLAGSRRRLRSLLFP